MNKRIFRHLIFWFAYFVENSLFEYTWIKSWLPNSRYIDLISQSLLMNLVLIPSKLMFTYFVFYFSIPRAFNKSANNLFTISVTFLFLLLCVLFHQLCAISLLINYPLFYTNVQHTYASVFDISGLFTGLLDLGFISGIAIALKLFRMQMANLKTEKDLTKGRLESELKFLKIQLNPHFLFNTLNNIYVLARKKSELAPEIILRLSKLLRFMLYEVEKKHIRIEEEIRILEDYIEVEKLRFSSHLMITFNKEIDDNNQRITPLILLPFIENAFKHGPREIVTETFIDIMIVLKDGNLKFTVNNSKENRENGSTLEKIGLINVRRQLELIYGEFKLVTENLGDSFRTELLINLKKHAAI